MSYLPDSSSQANLPDFSAYGYQANESLSYNRYSVQPIYKATDQSTGQAVVIKQIKFPREAEVSKTTTKLSKHYEIWDQFFNDESNTLRSLNHPNIPRLLASFEMSDDSRCIVMEYMPGRSLAIRRCFKPDQIKTIATSLLETLVYLQEERVPIVFHQDIKPANIVVDETSNPIRVSLVDFGFARIGSQELSMSLMTIRGTLAYMAPEQLYNRELTKAADLYGLGATLICLITGIEQNEIDDLKDYQKGIDFHRLATGFSLRFIEWLDTMVAPDPKERFPDAKTALEALKPLYVKRLPKCKLNTTDLQLRAIRLGEKVVGKITVTNPVPETVLEGAWEVQYHPQKDTTDWIRVEPTSFKGNEKTFRITADTSKLIAGKNFERTLVLHTPNAEPLAQSVQIRVRTAEIPISRKSVPCTLMVVQFVLFILAGFLGLWITVSVAIYSIETVIAIVIIVASTLVGAAYNNKFGAACGTLPGMIAAGKAVEQIVLITGSGFTGGNFVFFAMIATVILILLLLITPNLIRDFRDREYSQFTSILMTLLTSLFGASCGSFVFRPFLESLLIKDWPSTQSIFSLVSQWITISTITSGVLLALFFILQPLWLYLKISRYRKQENHLIKP